MVLFCYGCIVYSFLNVVALRMVSHENFITGRSHCPYCQHSLMMRDMIPIVGFMLLKGRCRYCHHALSWRYPLMEVLGGIIFVVLGKQGKWLEIVLISILIVIALIDKDTMMIPDSLMELMLVLLPFYIYQDGLMLLSRGIGLLLPGLLLIINRINESFGQGDIILLALLGVLLGYQEMLYIFILSIYIGCIIGIYYIWKKKENRMPFVPIIAIASLVCFIL